MKKTLEEMQEEAMGSRKNPRYHIFRDHDCGTCNHGELPCREGDHNRCSRPHARND